MNKKNKKINKKIREERQHIKGLNKMVKDYIDSDKLITEKLREDQYEDIAIKDRIADTVASRGGSRAFIIFFGTFIFLWVTVNIIVLSNQGFDPYPFILLNLFLSTLAALQAPVIMMSQNRKAEVDRKRAENDYLINLKAEIEIKSINDKIDYLMTQQIKNIYKNQQIEYEEIKKLERNVSKTKKNKGL